MVWNFTSEKLQNPEKFIKIFGKDELSPDISRETQITAMCWSLVQGDSVPTGGQEGLWSWERSDRVHAEPENQPVPVLSAFVCKEKYWKQKWSHLEGMKELPLRVIQKKTTRNQGCHRKRMRKIAEWAMTRWAIKEEMQCTNAFANEGWTYHGHYAIPCTISTALKAYCDRRSQKPRTNFTH